MKEIYITRGCKTIVDDEDFEWLNQWKWYISAWRVVSRKETNRTIFMHKMLISVPEGYTVDHKNGDRLDNRKENLRKANVFQQAHNRPKTSLNKSGFKGVSWSKIGNKWVAQIKINNKQINLGYFKGKLQAAKKYNEVASKFHGTFARLNVFSS